MDTQQRLIDELVRLSKEDTLTMRDWQMQETIKRVVNDPACTTELLVSYLTLEPPFKGIKPEEMWWFATEKIFEEIFLDPDSGLKEGYVFVYKYWSELSTRSAIRLYFHPLLYSVTNNGAEYWYEGIIERRFNQEPFEVKCAIIEQFFQLVFATVAMELPYEHTGRYSDESITYFWSKLLGALADGGKADKLLNIVLSRSWGELDREELQVVYEAAKLLIEDEEKNLNGRH